MNRYKRKKSKETTAIIISQSQELLLSDTDRVTYIFKYRKIKNNKAVIIEVVNVSYEILIGDEWITIVRFDSSHGFLHQHIRFSIENEEESVTTEGIKQRGGHRDWLRWAIKDIRTKYFYYKKQFLKRSKV